jgi:AraC-like DNA-binding protein
MRSTFEADGYGSLSRPISEIAGLAGFSSVSHFSRLFRQRFGDSPMGSDMGRSAIGAIVEMCR